MDEMEEQERSKTIGCGCLLTLIGGILPLLCFVISLLLFQAVDKAVAAKTVLTESASPDGIYILKVIRRDTSFHRKLVVYIETGDRVRIQVGVVSQDTFDASRVLIEWSDDNNATITLNGDYDKTIYFTAPSMFSLSAD